MSDDGREPLLDVHEVARILHVSVGQVRRLGWSGELPSVRVGRLVRWRLTAVTAYLNRAATLPDPVSDSDT